MKSKRRTAATKIRFMRPRYWRPGRIFAPVNHLLFDMRFSFRPALALLLGASATLLTACDYASLSPGENTQYKGDFSNPPGYTNADVNADSINYKQNVHTPIGLGSATALKNGTVDDQINSSPAGKSASSPQTASGTLGPSTQSQTKNNENPTGAGNSSSGASNAGGGGASNSGSGNM